MDFFDWLLTVKPFQGKKSLVGFVGYVLMVVVLVMCVLQFGVNYREVCYDNSHGLVYPPDSDIVCVRLGAPVATWWIGGLVGYFTLDYYREYRKSKYP